MSTSGMKKRRPSAILLLIACALVLAKCPPGAAQAQTSVLITSESQDTVPGPVTPLQPWMTVTTGERIGAFELLVERDTSPEVSHHFVSGWTKIHLSFTTPDNRANVTLTDNEASLVVTTRTSNSCASSTFYYQYRESADGIHLYDAMADALRDVVQACPRGMEAVLPLFTRAEADFPAAMQAMMTKVGEIFHGRLARCENPAASDDPLARASLAQQCHF